MNDLVSVESSSHMLFLIDRWDVYWYSYMCNDSKLTRYVILLYPVSPRLSVFVQLIPMYTMVELFNLSIPEFKMSQTLIIFPNATHKLESYDDAKASKHHQESEPLEVSLCSSTCVTSQTVVTCMVQELFSNSVPMIPGPQQIRENVALQFDTR